MNATIPADADVTMIATGNVVHLCPVVDEVDMGRATVTWCTDGATLELHALADYLGNFKDSRLSHEELTDRIRHELSTVPGIRLISVETTWLTAGLEVTCSTSPIPAGATP